MSLDQLFMHYSKGDNGDNWRCEALLMDRGHSKSLCNLQATSASNRTEGLFHDQNITTLSPCLYRFQV